jgi:hypothetical protein
VPAAVTGGEFVFASAETALPYGRVAGCTYFRVGQSLLDRGLAVGGSEPVRCFAHSLCRREPCTIPRWEGVGLAFRNSERALVQRRIRNKIALHAKRECRGAAPSWRIKNCLVSGWRFHKRWGGREPSKRM